MNLVMRFIYRNKIEWQLEQLFGTDFRQNRKDKR